MRRALLCGAVAVVVLLQLAGSPLVRGGGGPPADPTEGAGEYLPVSKDLSADPGPDAWLRNPHPWIFVKVLNTSFTPVVERSRLLLEGKRLPLSWDPDIHVATGTPEAALRDGSHGVEIRLEDASLNVLSASWRFHVDTVAPVVTFGGLPALADERVYPINGTVDEPNLEGVKVNGFAASVSDGRFSVPVLLWPARNELTATATDRARNQGMAYGEIQWYPPRRTDLSYRTFVHPNSSFLTLFPTTWELQLDAELDLPGFRADVHAYQPTQGILGANVAIVSRFVGDGMTDVLLLALMEDALATLRASGNVDVVSRPRLVPLVPRSVTGQFSVVETPTDAPMVFRLVTLIWNGAAGRVWFVIGSVSSVTLAENWDPLQTALEGFQAIEPVRPPPPGDSPRGAVDRAFVVTVAAIVFIVALFVLVVRSVRERRRSRRPPPDE